MKINKIMVAISCILAFSISCTTMTNKENNKKINSVEEKINNKISNSTWKLEKINNEIIDENIDIKFNENEKKISGKSAVNNYFGNYTENGNEIKLNLIGLTRMAGPEKLMNLEQKYIQLLSEVTTFEIKKDKLILKTSNGELILKKIN